MTPPVEHAAVAATTDVSTAAPAAPTAVTGAAKLTPTAPTLTALPPKGAPVAAATAVSSVPTTARATTTCTETAKAAEATKFVPSSSCRQEGKDDSVVEADVLIAGTGLAGCFTAAALARRGVKVVQIDSGSIYGGAYKSLKLSELCDWVRAEGRDEGQTLSFDVAASAALPAAPAIGDVVETVEAKTTAAAAGIAAGEYAAAVVLPGVSAAAQAAASPSETGGLVAAQGLPLSARSAAAGGGGQREQHGPADKHNVDFTGCTEAVPRGNWVSPQDVFSVCASASAALAEAKAGSAGGATSLNCPEWVCSLEESASAASFSLRREWQEPAATHEQSNTTVRVNTASQAKDEERDASVHAEASVLPKHSVKTRAAVWEDGQRVFFSSRSFSFFPFATDGRAKWVTGLCDSSTAVKTLVKGIPSRAEESGSDYSEGKERGSATAAAAARGEGRKSSLAAVAAGAAEAREDACLQDTAGKKHKGKAGSGAASTEGLFQRGEPSFSPALVSNAPISAMGGSPVEPSVEDEEALKKGLLKCNRFSIDLVPRVLYSNSAVAHILVTCGAAKYVEFRPIDSPVYVGELEADVPGTQEPSRGGGGGGASEEAATPEEVKKRRQLPALVVHGTAEAEEKSRGKGEKGMDEGRENVDERTGKDGDEASTEELSLVQMPLTRSSIFSSSLLTIQEKRLLMKFISSVAAPKLNTQFLSAARLWSAGKQTVRRAFDSGRISTAGPAAAAGRVTPPAQTAASAEVADRRKKTEGDSASFCVAGSDVSLSSKNAVVNASQHHLATSDVALQDMSWEEYLELHQLTEKLQRYLSYGVCVSDFPLRHRANDHGKVQSNSPATVVRACRTREKEASEGDEQQVTKRRRKDDGGRITMQPPTSEDESWGGCCTGGSWKASEGHARLLAFVQSVGLYENHSGAWLYPLYGTGDLPQALARAASLSGAIYMLNAGLVELKIICRPLYPFALSSSLSGSLSSIPDAYACASSPTDGEFVGLHSTLGSEGKGAPNCQSASERATSTEVKPSLGDPVSKKDYSGYDSSAFVSKFHTALATAEALEVKLETGVTVKTRLLLFEADALPPLYQRVRTRVSSPAPAHACAGYEPGLISSGQVKNGLPPLEAPAQRGEARTFPGSSAAPEHSAHVPQAPLNDVKKVGACSDRQAGGACTESPRALNNKATAPRHKMHAVKASEEDTFARWTNVHSSVHLGELLFPVLGRGGTLEPAPHAASTERRRQERGTEEDTPQNIEPTGATKEEKLLRHSHPLCSEGDPDTNWPEDAPRRGGGHELSQTAQQTQKTVDERPAVCSAPRSVADYYTQASCHLIALCRRSVLNGPGFRMGVCSVRSNKMPTFFGSADMARHCRHAPTVNVLRSFTSLVKPGSVAGGSTYLASADDSQATTTFAASVETAVGSEEGTSNMPRDAATKARVAPRAVRVEFSCQACKAASACTTTPAREGISTTADCPASALLTSRATTSACTRPRSSERATKCTCQPGGTLLPSEGNTLGRQGDIRIACSTHTRNGTCSPSTKGVVGPSSVPYVGSRTSTACKATHEGAPTAWPVLVLQTDGTCGTAPADYVLLHLSHIDGPGVDTCGCTSYGKPPRSCYESRIGYFSTESGELCTEGDAAAAGLAEDFRVFDSADSMPGCQRDAPGIGPTARAAASLVGAGVEKSTPTAREGGHACCKKSEPRPCAMLMYVLRRLLERGRHREAAAQDCIFACGYVLRTLRADIEKQLQEWQSRRFRGAIRKSDERHKAAEQAVLRHASNRKLHGSEEETNTVVNKAAAGPTCAVNAPGGADATGALTAMAFCASGSIAHVSQQCPIAGGEAVTSSYSFAESEAPKSSATRKNGYMHAAEEILPNYHMSVDEDNPASNADVEKCGCLCLPAVPSTPLLFLLQEPRACRHVLEVLLDKRIKVTECVPAHVCQEAEDAAQELQRFSAPYDSLSEIVAAVP